MTLELKNGNCLELMKSIPDKSIDLMICDLPYGETNCKWDIKIDMDEFWTEFKRIRKSPRVACIHFCSTKFGYQLIKSWEKGFKMDMVWKKRNKTGGLQSRNRPMRNHEMVYFFYDQAPKYNRDKYHKRIKSYPAKKENGKDEFGNDNKGVSVKECGFASNFDPPNPASVVEEEDEPKSMFESTKVFIGKRHHQTEKPQDILEFFIKYWTDENETILDPTMGSGSTGVACKSLNRNFIGFELDPKIFNVAEDRINKTEKII
tara:strand:+ start:96 stop:878 length:783 start_codon:yes stop_codon:yes gene_type:complete